MSDTYPANRPKFIDILQAANQLQQQLDQEGYSDEDILGALESETDVLAIMDRTIERIVADERLAASAKERARRLEARAENRRGLLDVIMKALKRNNVERPLATVYYASVPPSVIIDNADDLEERYMARSPDKALIAKALKAGTKVLGASLSEPKQSLRLKVT